LKRAKIKKIASEWAKRRWSQPSGRLNTNLEWVVPIREVCLSPGLVGDGRRPNTNLEEVGLVCEAWLGPRLVGSSGLGLGME
jgi:hypothetical protein